MSLKPLDIKELQNIFSNRFLDKKKEWNQLKTSFIESGIETLLDERVNSITFHVVYFQIANLKDEEIFNHLVEDLT